MVGTTRSRWLGAMLSVAVLAFVASGLIGCGKETPEPTASPNDVAPLDALMPAPVLPDETPDVSYEPSVSLQSIIKAAETWDASFRPWWGKVAPADLALTDIGGNVHSLGDYRGRNVLVVIWRTQIGQFREHNKRQVSHLKQLRDSFPEESLAILAISDESTAVLEEFVGQHGINYTVLTGGGNLPAPFGDAQYAPASFFIDPQGRVKLAATGLIPTSDAAAIIRAQ